MTSAGIAIPAHSDFHGRTPRLLIQRGAVDSNAQRWIHDVNTRTGLGHLPEPVYEDLKNAADAAHQVQRFLAV